jgi:hypothetical protein
MQEVHVVTLQSQADLTQDLIKKILEEDVVVLRNFESVFRIQKDLFKPSHLSARYGATVVDVITQDPNASVMNESPQSWQVKS